MTLFEFQDRRWDVLLVAPMFALQRAAGEHADTGIPGPTTQDELAALARWLVHLVVRISSRSARHCISAQVTYLFSTTLGAAFSSYMQRMFPYKYSEGVLLPVIPIMAVLICMCDTILGATGSMDNQPTPREQSGEETGS